MGGQNVVLPVLVQQEVLRRGGGLEGELQGVLVHRLRSQGLPRHRRAGVVGAGEHRKGRPPQGGAGRVGQEGNGIRPVLRRHRGAVVEGGLLIQVEQGGRSAVGALPGGRRAGLQGAVGVDIGQAVVNLVVNNTGVVAPRGAVVGHQSVPGIG